MSDMVPWTIAKSEQLYGFPYWGAGYFRVNDRGNVVRHARRPAGPRARPARPGRAGPPARHQAADPVPLQRHPAPPACATICARLPGGHDRIRLRGRATAPSSRSRSTSSGTWCDVIRGRPAVRLGLEVGSKPELVAVAGDPGHPERAADLQRLQGPPLHRAGADGAARRARGHHRHREALRDRPACSTSAAELGVEPEIGFRLRLAGSGAGRWERSGGERAKFGLNVAEIVSALELPARARQAGLRAPGALPQRQPADEHLVAEAGRARGRAGLRAAGAALPAARATSTSAAAWPSTTTAPRRRPSRR